MPRSIEAAISVLAVAALVVSILAYQDELRTRVPVDEAIARYGLDIRRPAEVEALRLQPSADLRAAYLCNMTLSDVYGNVALGTLSSTERAAWIRSLTTIDDQLGQVRDLSLSALVRRPGWAFHHAYTGEIEYAALRRRALDVAADESSKWEIPLLNGMNASHGNLSFPSYLGGAYLETWGRAELNGDPAAVLRLAMKSSRFVSRNYRAVTILLGSEQAMDLLPNDPGVLRTALGREQRDGNVASAVTLMQRIDGAERTSRAESLERIRERRRLGDVWGQRAAAAQWAATYRPEDLDDARGRREVAEVLSLWPDTKRGAWLTDPRGRLVRYFLSGREESVKGEVLRSVTRLLSDVPAPVEAQIAALAGDTWEADQLIRSSGSHSFEWTPVAVGIARSYLEKGDPEKARKAIGLAPSTSFNECNVLLVRSEIEGDTEDDADDVDEILRELTPDEFPSQMWSRTGAISLCVDPGRHQESRLIVSLSSSEGPSLVSYGWDGGRIGSVVVDGQMDLELSLSGIEGRHPLRVWTETGPGVEIGRARIIR